MTGRAPICEDAAAIAARLREIQAERTAVLGGCTCPPDGSGGQTHRPGCPLEPRPASRMELAREAIQRARGRARQKVLPHLSLPICLAMVAPAINSEIPWLGRWGSGDFHTSPSGGAGSRLDVGRLPDAAGSTNPASLEGLK